jgi:hypothetical protein
LTDMCSQLQAYDNRQSMLSETGQNNNTFQSSANAAARDRPPYPNRRDTWRHDGG